jgi:N-acetylneuraminic acid mutarotase
MNIPGGIDPFIMLKEIKFKLKMKVFGVIIKILVSTWFLIINFFPGSCMHNFNESGIKGENQNLLKSCNHKENFKFTKSINMEIKEIFHQDIKEKYYCSVTEGASLPVGWARGGHAGGIMNSQIIVAGGTDWSEDKTTKYWLKNTAVFNNRKWHKGPELPKPLAYAMYGYNDSGFYLAGGSSDGKSVSKEVYWINSLDEQSEWKSLPDLPEAVFFGAGVVFNDKFYITCGSVNDKSINTMWYLDLNRYENGWKECKSLPGAGRVLPAFVACGKYLYLIGGLKRFSPLEPLSDLYRYSPDDDEWEKLNDLPQKGYGWVSQSIDNNHILLTGRADGIVHDGIWIVNLKNSSMNKIGHLIIPSATAPLVKVTDEYFWLIGGEPDSNKNRTEKVSVIEIKS